MGVHLGPSIWSVRELKSKKWRGPSYLKFWSLLPSSRSTLKPQVMNKMVDRVHHDPVRLALLVQSSNLQRRCVKRKIRNIRTKKLNVNNLWKPLVLITTALIVLTKRSTRRSMVDTKGTTTTSTAGTKSTMTMVMEGTNATMITVMEGTNRTMTTVTEGTKSTVEDMVPRMAKVTEDKSTVAVTDPMEQVNMAVDTDPTVAGTEFKSTVVNTVATTKDTSNTVKTLMVPTEIPSIILRLTLTFNKHLLNTTIKMSLTKGTKRPEISLRLQKRTNPKTSAFHSLPNTSPGNSGS